MFFFVKYRGFIHLLDLKLSWLQLFCDLMN